MPVQHCDQDTIIYLCSAFSEKQEYHRCGYTKVCKDLPLHKSLQRQSTWNTLGMWHSFRYYKMNTEAIMKRLVVLLKNRGNPDHIASIMLSFRAIVIRCFAHMLRLSRQMHRFFVVDMQLYPQTVYNRMWTFTFSSANCLHTRKYIPLALCELCYFLDNLQRFATDIQCESPLQHSRACIPDYSHSAHCSHSLFRSYAGSWAAHQTHWLSHRD